MTNRLKHLSVVLFVAHASLHTSNFNAGILMICMVVISLLSANYADITLVYTENKWYSDYFVVGIFFFVSPSLLPMLGPKSNLLHLVMQLL